MREPGAATNLAPIVYRQAVPGDFRTTWDIFLEAADHLARTRGWAPTRRPADPPERFLAFRRSVLRHDPDGFWVAESDGGLVGFGIATQREHVWYLAALHVRPAFQARGIGAEIIRRALGMARPGSVRTVGAEARNPVSNALYGRFGMFPETVLVELSGPATDRRSGDVLRPGLPNGHELDPIDRATLAAARPEDHEFWGSVPDLHAFTVIGRGGGRVAGYAYVQADGAIGPIAVLDPADLVPALDASIAAAADLGATAARVRIPGVARAAVADLLAHGWRYGDSMTLVLTSAPWARWDGYVTSGADALL